MAISESVAIVGTNIIACIVCQTLLFVIRSYHENKSLEMQSFLSKVIIISIHVFHLVGIFGPTVFSLIEILGSVEYQTAVLLSLVEYIIGVMCYFSLLIMTTTKYLSIYHSTIVNELNEEQVLLFLKRLIFVFPITLASLEFSLWTNIEDTESFQIFHPINAQSGSKSRIGYGMLAMILCNFFAALFLQGCLEYDFYHQQTLGNISWIAKLKEWFLAKKADKGYIESAEFKLGIARALVAILFVLIVCLAIQTIFNAFGFKIILLIFFIILGNVCPLIFIVNHPGMRAQGQKLFKSFIC